MEDNFFIISDKSPREIIASCFPSLKGGLPIQGGWGYAKEDACIIEKIDPLNISGLPFDGVGVEYIFVEKRIYVELIVNRPTDQRFSGINWKLLEQKLTHENNRSYDRLSFEVTAVSDKDWKELKTEFEGPQGYGTDDFDIDVHNQKRLEKTVQFVRDFWFDITSFY